MYFVCLFLFFFFKQKTAYEMRISDWSSDVCSSDLAEIERLPREIVARGETVDDAGIGCLRHLLAKQRQRIRLRIAAMDDDRQTRLLRHMDVTAKTVPLPRPVALVLMIIEPGLADADDARVRGARHQLRRIDIGMMVSVVRVDADARPDVAVRLGRGEHRVP